MNPFLGHFFHAGNSPLGIFLIVKGDDFDVVGGATDFHATGFVDQVCTGLHGPLVRDTPACSGARGYTDKTNF